MNRKQLTSLVVIGLIIGGLGVFVLKWRAASWNRPEAVLGKKILGDFAINDVHLITIKATNAELNLAKGDVWTVKERGGYPADFGDITDLLRKLVDLKTIQTVTVGPSQYGRLQLLSPAKDQSSNAATLLEFKDKDGKVMKSLLLGKKYLRDSGNDSQFGGGGFPVGRYVMVPESNQGVSLVSESFSDVEPKPDSWISKDWFKVEKLKSIAVSGTNPTNSWKVSRDSEAAPWILADVRPGEEIDTNRLSSVGYALSSPSFNDVLAPDAKPEATGTNQPVVATLETTEGFTYTVKVGTKTGEDTYPVNVAVSGSLVKERTPGKDEKPEDKEKLDKEFKDKLQKLEDKLKQEKSYEKWTYLVSKWTVDPLLKERTEFYQEKKAEANPADAKASPGTEPDPDILKSIIPQIPGLDKQNDP